MTDFAELVRGVIDGNVYMTLGTADETGRPWVSPVYYVADAWRDLYWISSPDVTHSRNLARRPEVGIVVFDSRAPVGTGGSHAVYLAATAAVVPDVEIEGGMAVYAGGIDIGARAFTAADVRPPSPYRLYRATVAEYSVLCPRETGERCGPHGLAHDHRTEVVLG